MQNNGSTLHVALGTIVITAMVCGLIMSMVVLMMK